MLNIAMNRSTVLSNHVEALFEIMQWSLERCNVNTPSLVLFILKLGLNFLYAYENMTKKQYLPGTKFELSLVQNDKVLKTGAGIWWNWKA